MAEIKNILFAGVGGQGIILASKILAAGLINAGYDVKMSEVHGMAQRGGSVTTQVRYGEKVYSPIIGKGQADLLVSFESMEAMRWLDYMNPNGKVVVNDQELWSAPILMGSADYPEGVIDAIRERAETVVVKAGEIAAALGNPKTMNVVLVGTLIRAMGLEALDWDKVIRETVKPQFVEINLKALKEGMAQFK
ncbi:indolepyruvate oxidoreductase subunit beta [Acidaminobacter hydrogenoformans]|uniref:Indolepyruvate ferredoxin oxidoreductase beta subunit n=1 Tax=Acidaminobacter hydrogenoformans DSM 2784 TaxID=1120920 RepID=A0A1G5RUJ5_9FIRM|nr:indolepyruvate oxidoreductase subunit beta [Acidaminobacter hydrogenoformans]SCZ77538.1 indolepyruvate ferredoxin oxidoreductase beta subunit [Acidaminobacter hydrogenoformans DSM 2784]